MAEVKQPEIDVQELLSDLTRNERETIEVDGRVTTIGWLHKDTEARIAHLMLKEKNAEKRIVKWFSLIKLDRKSGFLTWLLSWLGYWIYWRWIWYVKRERCSAFQMEVILTKKKKNQGAIRRIRSDYRIDDRGNGHDDDDSSTRAWPSRTTWGGNHSVAEKLPFLFIPFMGIMEYGWRFGYTSAQIDLMIIDQPTVDYSSNKDKRGKKSMIATKQEEDEMKDLVEAWKKDRNGKTYAGKTFSLNDFMEGKVE